MSERLKTKLWSVAKGAAIAAVGAGLAYALQAVSGLAGAGELGDYGPMIAAACAIAVNAIRKALESDPVEALEDPDVLPFTDDDAA